MPVTRLIWIVALGLGCGTRSGPEKPTGSSEPIAVYVKESGCVAPTGASADLGVTASANAVAVVEVLFQDECTGLGGQYVLAREIDGFREFWLGGHGCRFAVPTPPPRFGVVRYGQTAALFQIPAGICIGFTGGSGARTDASTHAIALFATLADARSFAASLPR